MSLSDKALCSVDDVEKETGATDDRFEDWIEDASAMIADYLGRVLERDDAIEESKHGDGTPFMVLNRPPLNAITSIEFDGEAVAAADYEIHEAEAGVVYFVGSPTVDTAYTAAGIMQAPVRGTERKSYVVTYDGGFVTPGQSEGGGAYAGDVVTLPRAIRRACVEMVTQLFNDAGRDTRVASESLMSHSTSYRGGDDDDDDGSGIPKPIRAKLSRWRFEDGA
jgi:hypothetical protein